MSATGKKLARVATLAWIGLVVTATAAGDKPPDVLTTYLSRFFNGYKNCGTLSSRDVGRSAVQQCVAESVAAKTPFIARFDHQGYESTVSDALVMLLSGNLAVVHYDPFACKNVECLAVDPCGSPKITIVGNVLRVTCKNTYEM